MSRHTRRILTLNDNVQNIVRVTEYDLSNTCYVERITKDDNGVEKERNYPIILEWRIMMKIM